MNHSMLLLTNCEVLTGKYLGHSFEVWTKQRLEFDMKYHFLHDCRTSTPFNEKFL